MMFTAKTDEHLQEIHNDNFIISKLDELETTTGWIRVSDLKPNMHFIINDSETNLNTEATIKSISKLDTGDYNILFNYI